MEKQELRVGEALYQDLFITSSQQCPQFTGQHFGVTTRDEDIYMVFGSIASDRLFPFFNVLYLIDQNIVMLVGSLDANM